MTPVDTQNGLLGAALVVQTAIAILTALYVRGKMDGGASAHERSQSTAIEQLRDDLAALETKLEQTRDISNATAQGLRAHQEECSRNAAMGQMSMGRIEKRLDDLVTVRPRV